MTTSRLLLIVVVAAGLIAAGALWTFGSRREVLQLPGLVEIQEVRLGSKVSGRVHAVFVREGDHVSAGQKLVEFEVPQLTAQRDQRKAQLRAAQADLDRLRQGPRHEEKEAALAAVGAAQARWERLKKGWREEEIRQASAELASAEADLKLAVEEYERALRLLRQNSISQAKFDAAKAARDRAFSLAGAAKARHEMLVRGSRPEEIAEAAADLRRAEWNHKLLLAGTRAEEIAAAEARVQELQAKLEELEADLREAVIVAPGPAVVEVLPVRPGDLVPPNQPLIRVLKADDLWVKVFVPETELGKVRLHDEVDVFVDSYPHKRFRGIVYQIASISEFTPRNIQSAEQRRHQVFAVKIRVDDPEGVFKAGMAARVEVPLRPAPENLDSMPREAKPGKP